jgi:hypothetical protein
MFGFFKKKPTAGDLDHALVVQMGTEADQFNKRGEYDSAVNKYREVIDTMLKCRVVDTYFAGKCVLGTLLAHVRAGKIEEAHQVWTSDMDSADGLGLGIYSLEQTDEQFHTEDTCLYLLICAYLHALSGSETSEDSTIHYLNIVTQYALKQNPKYKHAATNHWFIDTLILSRFEAPNRFSAVLEKLFEQLGKPDQSKILSLVTRHSNCVSFNQKGLAGFFPDPAPWEAGTGTVEFHPDGKIVAG